jgi:hypothetical protein
MRLSAVSQHGVLHEVPAAVRGLLVPPEIAEVVYVCLHPDEGTLLAVSACQVLAQFLGHDPPAALCAYAAVSDVCTVFAVLRLISSHPSSSHLSLASLASRVDGEEEHVV